MLKQKELITKTVCPHDELIHALLNNNAKKCRFVNVNAFRTLHKHSLMEQ